MNLDGKHIAILGGSFNPVHIGHIILADYVAQFTDVDMVWLMLSPLNPLKAASTELLPDSVRLEMLNIATRENPRIDVCSIELTLPRPSYSINSLEAIQKMHPATRFSLLIGSDNWCVFDQWRNHDEIISRFSPMIYPRKGYDVDASSLPASVRLINAPEVEISSTFIRNAIAEDKDMSAFLPEGVAQYITENNLYR